MTIEKQVRNGVEIAVCHSDEIVISDVRSALDFAMDTAYQTGCTNIAVNKAALCRDFFILSTGLAGEIMQKFVNYHIRFAVIGDFSEFTSKPLRDFFCETNKGTHIFFVASEAEAAEKFIRAAQMD
ncbi:MAG: DUF4180 domain-containing protein [Oscillospiraceae bacterium]